MWPVTLHRDESFHIAAARDVWTIECGIARDGKGGRPKLAASATVKCLLTTEAGSFGYVRHSEARGEMATLGAAASAP